MTVETFFTNFGHLADAPNGVQKLRELILQLAVQGKLVPQDENDEPASVLLERVKSDKERLVREGKFRKSKTALPVSVDEEPYRLPDVWHWTRLNDIADIGTGTTPSKTNPLYYSDGCVPWITSSATSCDLIKDAKTYISDLAVKECRLRKYPSGTLVVALYGQGKTRGQVAELVVEATVNQACSTITVGDRFPELKSYIRILFEKQYDELRALAAGGAQPNLNVGKIKEILVPLPPLKEQKRIVAKVDQLTALCDELETRQQKQQQVRVRLNNSALDGLLTAREPDEFTDHWQRICTNFDLLYDHPETIAKLRAAILQLAVQGKLVPQDPNDEPASVLLERIRVEKERLVKEGRLKKSKPLPKIDEEEIPFVCSISHLFVRLLDVCLAVTDGDHQPPPKTESGVPFLVIGNVRSGQLNFTGSRFVSSKYFNNLDPIRVPSKGDILYTVVGSYGIPVAVTTDDKFCVQRHIAIIKPSTLIDTDYLRYSLSSKSAFEQATDCATGIAQKTVPLSGLRKILIALPPIEEQKCIVAKVDQLMALCDELENKLNQAKQRSEKLMESTVRQLLVA